MSKHSFDHQTTMLIIINTISLVVNSSQCILKDPDSLLPLGQPLIKHLNHISVVSTSICFIKFSSCFQADYCLIFILQHSLKFHYLSILFLDMPVPRLLCFFAFLVKLNQHFLILTQILVQDSINPDQAIHLPTDFLPFLISGFGNPNSKLTQII